MSDQVLPASASPSGEVTTSSAGAQDELEQLLYIITHDLRAGFRAFKTIPDWIAEDLSPLPPDRQALLDGHVAMLRTQADRCDRMLVDLRDYSRIGRCADPSGPHALTDLLEQAAVAAALPAGFSLECQASATLLGPGNELVHLFAALLSNAAKHHDHVSGTIQVQATASGRMLRILVADDGPGIPARFHDAVFELLRTLRPRDDCEGSGMGLAIARKIVTRLGGTIAVQETGAHRGTTIALSVPGTLSGATPLRPH